MSDVDAAAGSAKGPRETATAYFRAIATRDVETIRRLFAPDAELVSMAGTFRGPDEIAEFYAQTAFGFHDLMPHPGPYLVDGERLAVEIELEMGGNRNAVADFFTIRDGLVHRLVIYMGPTLAKGQAS